MAHSFASPQPFSLTYVVYEEGDSLSLVIAFCSLLPVLAMVCHASHLLLRRELNSVLFFLGSLASVATTSLVKHIVKAPRPEASILTARGYGFPSLHAQLAAFILTSLWLALLFQWQARRLICLLFLLLSACVSAAVGYSRVYLGAHTLLQVVCGHFLGMLLAAIWYVLTPPIKRLAKWGLHLTGLNALLRVYDASLASTPFLQFEYEQYQRLNLTAAHSKSL
eukprot:TRINITY_DN7568_c0_g1_i1.p1 TRINITY_DN7568_c0_g1~~TRINITY_DN7568_c0_g1_i1.p1  ORF type:complete len:223 (+),score=25.51 TRINITY_DN7568_c0_g1_i1:28-696(+)